KILDGLKEFTKKFKGILTTETMLVKGINDQEDQITDLGKFISGLKPDISYLSIPTRPPAEKNTKPPNEEVVNRSFQLLTNYLSNVEYLIGYEGNQFDLTGDAVKDLLSITAVHPMKEEAVMNFLSKAKTDFSLIKPYIDKKIILEVEYQGEKFYVRRFQK
ncbi:MAG: radical SAM protein, partial [Candidatus Ranarchaeia archaeon]